MTSPARVRRPANVWPPLTFIQEELHARGWDMSDLADHANLELTHLTDVLNLQRPMTQFVADGIGRAFGTGPTVWLRLEATYLTALSEELGPGTYTELSA